MSPEEEYLAWRKLEPVGCHFARTIANHPERFGQSVQSILGELTPDAMAAEIARRIDGAIADPSVSSAAIVLSGVTTLEFATMAFLALSSHPGWAVEKSALQAPPADDMIVIRITKDIPYGQGRCPSEALVLGPFDDFPPTRRAPVLAFEIYVGEPRPFDPKEGTLPTTKANLAHIEMNLPTHRAFQKTWNKTVESRRKSLGGDDNRAKAKVSLVISTALATKLGCLP